MSNLCETRTPTPFAMLPSCEEKQPQGVICILSADCSATRQNKPLHKKETTESEILSVVFKGMPQFFVTAIHLFCCYFRCFFFGYSAESIVFAVNIHFDLIAEADAAF